MSHSRLRDEKDCLNCGNVVQDRFCTHCGQENLQIRDSAPHLILHYVQDLFHYDGKMWHTVKKLLRQPGQVQVEYMEGKRKRYLEPIRFYVFASTVFFLLFFVMIPAPDLKDDTHPKYNISKRLHNLQQEKEFAEGTPDTVHANQLIQSVNKLNDSLDGLEVDTLRPETTLEIFSDSDTIRSQSWFGRLIEKRAIQRTRELGEKDSGDRYKGMSDFLNDLIHKIPQLLFLSLPFFAFFLKLLYFKSPRKKYVDHFIFSIYQYAYVFVLLTGLLLVQWLADSIHVQFMSTLTTYLQWALFIYFFVYLYLSMRRFYNDRFWPLMFRYWTLMFLMSVTFIFLMVLFFILTFLM